MSQQGFENQNRFMATLRRALGRPEGRSGGAESVLPREPERASRKRLARIRERTAADRRRLLDRLCEAAAPLGTQVTVSADAAAAARHIARLVDGATPEWGLPKIVSAWRHPMVDALNLDRTLSVPVHRAECDPSRPETAADRREARSRMAESVVGVTGSDFCLADTATVVLRTGPGRARGVSLLPTIHVAVVSADSMMYDLGELYSLLTWDPEQRERGLSTCLTLISGPSKTGDIEATLVHGAHGPRELHLIVVNPHHGVAK